MDADADADAAATAAKPKPTQETYLVVTMSDVLISSV